jgi:hypothetical protein
MTCDNCGYTVFTPLGSCMQCGRGIRVGPSPEPERRRPTEEELVQKRRKAEGRLLSPEEAQTVRKKLGFE